MALLPLCAFAAGNTSIQSQLIVFLGFVNNVLVPLIFSIAFLFLIWGFAKFFIFKGSTEEGRDSGKRLLLYGVLGLVIMISIWGIVRMAMGAFDINKSSVPCPDFNRDCYSQYRDYGSSDGFTSGSFY